MPNNEASDKSSKGCFDSAQRDRDFDSRIPDNMPNSFLDEVMIVLNKEGNLDDWDESFNPDSPVD